MDKIVYLMRGLPSCGKSHMARRLAGETGIVCETDAYFYTEVGDDPEEYDYDRALLGEAQDWSFARFTAAVDADVTPIVVDRGNSLSLQSQKYARYAVQRGYSVELREPDSPWWNEIRILLKYKQVTKVVLLEWAERLSALSQGMHRVGVDDITRQMAKWKHDLTVEDILNFEPSLAASVGSDGLPAEGPGEALTAATVGLGATIGAWNADGARHREEAIGRAMAAAEARRTDPVGDRPEPESGTGDETLWTFDPVTGEFERAPKDEADRG